MTPANLLKNGWARTATASVVPMFLDSLLMFGPSSVEVGGEEYKLGPQFGNARSSGSPTEALFGSPAVDQFNSAAQFTRGALNSWIEGDELTQSQIRSGFRAFAPLSNWVPFTAALGALIEDRPEK